MPAIEVNKPKIESGTAQNWPEILLGEELICGLLSKAFYIFPEKAWLQSLIDEDVFSEAPFGAGRPEIDSGLAELNKWSIENCDGLTQNAFDAVQADYMHLFVGPGKVLAPPWESVYTSKSHVLFQKETLQVRSWYRRFGLQVEHFHHQPDDHIGIEFSFLAHIAHLMLEEYDTGNQKRFTSLLKAQSEFIRTHLLRWVPSWFVDVAAHARLPFYPGVAQVACGVLLELREVLDPKQANKVI